MEDQYFVAHDDKRHTSCEDEIHKKPSKKVASKPFVEEIYFTC